MGEYRKYNKNSIEMIIIKQKNEAFHKRVDIFYKCLFSTLGIWFVLTIISCILAYYDLFLVNISTFSLALIFLFVLSVIICVMVLASYFVFTCPHCHNSIHKLPEFKVCPYCVTRLALDEDDNKSGN